MMKKKEYSTFTKCYYIFHTLQVYRERTLMVI